MSNAFLNGSFTRILYFFFKKKKGPVNVKDSKWGEKDTRLLRLDGGLRICLLSVALHRQVGTHTRVASLVGG